MATPSLTEEAEQCLNYVKDLLRFIDDMLSSGNQLSPIVLSGTRTLVERHKNSLSAWRSNMAKVRLNPDQRSHNKAVKLAADCISLIHERAGNIRRTLEESQAPETLSENGM